MAEAKKVELNQDELPEGWVVSTLGDIASYIQRGKSPKYTELSELPVVNQKCVRWHGIDREHLKYIHPDQFEKWEEKRFLQNGDLLWNSTGTGTIGRAAIVHLKEGEKLVADSHVTIVRSGEGMEPKYVHYWVMGPAVQNSIEAMQSGSTNQVELSKGAVETTPIPVAPPEQQKRIVAKIEELFSHIDAGIEALKKAKQLLKQYRQSVLKAAVTGELTKEWREANKDKLEPVSQLLERILKERREKWEEQQLEQFKAKGKMPKDDKWKEKYKEPELGGDRFFSDIPAEWSVASIDQLAWDVRYGSSSKTNDNEKGVPVLRMGNIVDGQLDYTDLKYLPKNHDEFPDLLLEDGDLLFNRTNSAELVGKTAVFRDIGRQASLASYLIRVRVVSGVEPDFAAYFINSSCGRNWIKSCVSQNVGQANVNGTKLKALVMPLPSLEEQKEIVRCAEEKIESSDRLLSELDHQLFKVEKNKQSILASAFTGELE